MWKMFIIQIITEKDRKMSRIPGHSLSVFVYIDVENGNAVKWTKVDEQMSFYWMPQSPFHGLMNLMEFSCWHMKYAACLDFSFHLVCPSIYGSLPTTKYRHLRSIISNPAVESVMESSQSQLYMHQSAVSIKYHFT